MTQILLFIGRLPLFALIGLSASSVIIGDLASKQWSVSRQSWIAIIGLVGYFCSGLFYIPSLLKRGLVITSIVWMVLDIVGMMIIGLVIYGERLTAWQTVGIGLGIISMLILTLTA